MDRGLMALVFHGGRSGRDESAEEGGPKPDRDRDDLGSRP
jgi:hypothetical protein